MNCSCTRPVRVDRWCLHTPHRLGKQLSQSSEGARARQIPFGHDPGHWPCRLYKTFIYPSAAPCVFEKDGRWKSSSLDGAGEGA